MVASVIATRQPGVAWRFTRAADHWSGLLRGVQQSLDPGTLDANRGFSAVVPVAVEPEQAAEDGEANEGGEQEKEEEAGEEEGEQGEQGGVEEKEEEDDGGINEEEEKGGEEEEE